MSIVACRIIADYPDSDAVVGDVVQTESGSVGAQAGSRELDALIDQARIAVDPGVREALYRQIEESLEREVRVVPLDAGWDDVGSWDAAAKLREEGGKPPPEAILVDSDGSAVFGDGTRVVAVVDVPGVVVVDAGDALLVVSRRASEKVRAVVEALRARGREDLL